jgi:hypothetical protein
LGGLVGGGATALLVDGVVGVGATASSRGEVGTVEEVLVAATDLLGIIVCLAATAPWGGEVRSLEEIAVTAGLPGWVVGTAVAAKGLAGASLHDLSIRTAGLEVCDESARHQVGRVLAAGEAGRDDRVSTALLSFGAALAKSVVSSVELAAFVASGDGLVHAAFLSALGDGVDVKGTVGARIGHCAALLGLRVDDVAVAAGVGIGVEGLAVAAAGGGLVVDLFLAATVDGRVVSNSVAALGQSTSSRNQLAVSTASLLGVVVALPRVLSSLTAGLASAIDEVARAASLVGSPVDGGATAVLCGEIDLIDELGTTAHASSFSSTENTNTCAARF